MEGSSERERETDMGREESVSAFPRGVEDGSHSGEDHTLALNHIA